MPHGNGSCKRNYLKESDEVGFNWLLMEMDLNAPWLWMGTNIGYPSIVGIRQWDMPLNIIHYFYVIHPLYYFQLVSLRLRHPCTAVIIIWDCVNKLASYISRSFFILVQFPVEKTKKKMGIVMLRIWLKQRRMSLTLIWHGKC